MDVRVDVLAICEAIIRVHDVDEQGDCVACRRAGVLTEYPCDVRLLAELRVDAMACRLVTSGGYD